jgi:hypothetical protein
MELDRKENKARTARAALIGYVLMIEKAKNTPFYKPDFSAKPEAEKALQKAFGTIDTLKRKLEGLVDGLDSKYADASFVEKITRGQGATEYVEGEENTTISAVLKTLNQSTNSARYFLSMLQECSAVMTHLMQDKVTSVYHADFLVRTVKELLGPTSVFCKALNQGEDNTPEEKQEFNNACRVMSNIGSMIKDQPYVKLRSLVCDMFGVGAVREFEGYCQGNPSVYAQDYDLSTKEGLDGFVSLVGSVTPSKINQAVLDYSDGMAQALREVLEQIKDDKIEVKGAKEAIDFLNAYSASDAKTATEAKAAVEKEEFIFKRTTKGITDAKLKGKNFLPVAGIGQVLNPLRYQGGARSKDLIKLQEVMKNAYVVYRGWQDLQDKLLTSTRILCGFARNRSSNILDKQGGESWFKDAMDKISYNNIQADPKYNSVISGSLEELAKAYFAVESENTKMRALPILLLSKNDEIRTKVDERIKTENKVSAELKELIQKIAKKDFAQEIALALKDASIPVCNFHKIKNSVREQESPQKIAATHFLKFCKAIYQNTEKGKTDENLRVLLQKKIKDSPDYNSLALRLCEMCGFAPSNVGTLKGGLQYEKKDAQSAYLEVVEELSRENNAEVLNSALALFEDYKPWKASYEKEVARQVEKRKAYEVERAIGWQEVFRSTCEALCPKKEDEGYKISVARSANIANTLVCSLLADAILKDAGYRDKKRIDSELGNIARRLWDKSQDKAVLPSPAEDTAVELFLEPLIRREYEIAVSKAENVLTKDAVETVEVKKGSSITFVNNGAFIDFDENVVMQSFGQIKGCVALKEGARGNAPLEEYAQAQLNALATDCWFPEDKYAGIEISADNFSAETQKRLFEEIGTRVKEGNIGESFDILDQVEKNNPFFCLVGAKKEYRVDDIKEEILRGNADIESLFKECRWADSNAQFSERMGGTSDAVKLKMSQRALDEKKAEIQKAKDASLRFATIEIEDKKALVVELLPSVCKVFCSEVGYLVGKDITDGEKALELGLQVARSKEVLERGVVAQHRNEILPALAEYVQTIEGTGEYEVGFQTHIPSQVALDLHREYAGKDTAREAVSEWAPDALYQIQDGRMTPEEDFKAFLTRAGVNVVPKNEEAYSKLTQKQLFGRMKREDKPKSEVKAGESALLRSEVYVKEIEASSPIKTYAQSLANTILKS